MMSEQLVIAACSLIGLVIVAATALKGWQEWIALKSRELEALRKGPAPLEGRPGEGATRIEIADLKERIRKLEAIASGVDL